MNPFGLDATGLMVWGLVAHLIADWPLQNDWMANNKAKRASEWVAPSSPGYQQALEDTRLYFGILFRHPAAYVHAGIHGLLLALVFGWVAAPLAVAHLIIDTRVPVVWWSRLVRQTQPEGVTVTKTETGGGMGYAKPVPVVDIGLEVRFWTDQVFHSACIAAAALATVA